MSAPEAEHGLAFRFAGAVAAFVVFACVLVALLAVLDASGASDRTVLFIGKAFTYSGFGALVIGWKWPQAVLGPFKRLVAAIFRSSSAKDNLKGAGPSAPSVLDTRLHSQAQRALFSLGCIGLLPWLFMRLVRELWRSAGIHDYLRSVFIQPLSPWFESGWWWHTKLEWYDWPVLPSLAAMVLAFAWPYTAARVVAWIRGPK